jgi:2-methoxy-6-polyprenyl-1,4-benzoquinol methylase
MLLNSSRSCSRSVAARLPLARFSASSRCLSSQSHSDPNARTTSFGFRSVPEDEKEGLVRGVFDSVASKYDLMNDATSFGVHRLWKDEFVSSLRPGRKGPLKCIDVGGGTGDIALRILDHAREKYADRETTVDIVDINGQMLKEGFKRFKKTMYHNSQSTYVIHSSIPDVPSAAPQVAFHEANAQELPSSTFPDNSYDLYTIAFCIRNCTSIPAVLKEAHRVLKPGGTFACLEFSKVQNPLLS